MRTHIEYMNKLSELVKVGSSMAINIKFNFDQQRLLDLSNKFEVLFSQLIAKEGV